MIIWNDAVSFFFSVLKFNYFLFTFLLVFLINACGRMVQEGQSFASN